MHTKLFSHSATTKAPTHPNNSKDHESVEGWRDTSIHTHTQIGLKKERKQYLYVRNNKFWRSKLCIHLANVFPELICCSILAVRSSVCCIYMWNRSLIFFPCFASQFMWLFVCECVCEFVGVRFRISISSASIWQRKIEQYKQTLPKVIPIISVCFGRQKHYNRILRLLLLIKIGFVVKYDIVLQSLCSVFCLEWQCECIHIA